MPLYIDLHIDPSLTPGEVEKAHVADKAIQEKYGVRYLQILLNGPEGHLFCLVEGPDKETCAKVHQLAHGNIACNILEITESVFNSLLSGKDKDGRDFTINKDGSLDTGIRAILSYSLLGSPDNIYRGREIINKVLSQSDGKSGEVLEDKTIMFGSCSAAIKTAMNIRTSILASNIPTELRLGLEVGMPIGEKGSLFEETRRSARHLAFMSGNNQLTVSSKVQQLYSGDIDKEVVRVINPPEEKFILHVLDVLSKIWSNGNITIAELAHELGLSKSQLTRKLKSLTPLSPNDFLKEYRLRNAVSLMEEQKLNIAEVSMAVGFSNAAYFAKCFRERFGKVPSHYLETA